MRLLLMAMAFMFAALNLEISSPVAGAAEDILSEASIPAVSKLNKAQREQLLSTLSEAYGYGDCRETVIECLKKNLSDPVALRSANMAAFLFSKGARQDDIKKILSERYSYSVTQTRHTFTSEGRPYDGQQDAPIVLYDFAEFKCPYCWEFLPLLHRLVSESRGKVRLVFKHYPLKSHKGSAQSSAAAEAAHRQGRFWEMAELLFRDMQKQERKDIERHALFLGLDIERFKKDLEDPSTLEAVEKDKAEGMTAGVTGTPSLFVNGKNYRLPRHEAFLKDVINEEAAVLNLPPIFPGNPFRE